MPSKNQSLKKRFRAFRKRAPVYLSRAAIIAIAAVAMIIVIMNIFLPLDRLQRAYNRFLEWARRQPFIKRGQTL